ncbi:hypothetical protein ACFLQ6_07980 [Thermoproteota archaeon]
MQIKGAKKGDKTIKIDNIDTDSVKSIDVQHTGTQKYIDKQQAQRTAQDELRARIGATRDPVPKVTYPDATWIDMFRAWLTYKTDFNPTEAFNIIKAENEALSRKQSEMRKAKEAADDTAAAALLAKLHDKWENSKQFVQVWTDLGRQKLEGGVSFDRDKGILQWKCIHCGKVHTCDIFVNVDKDNNQLIADHVLLQLGCWQRWECEHDRKSNLPLFADISTAIWFDSEASRRHVQNKDAAVILSETPPEILWKSKDGIRVRGFKDNTVRRV